MKLIQNYIKSGVLTGSPADRLLEADGDTNVLRPYIGHDGRTYVTHVTNAGLVQAVPLTNVQATLRKDAWKLLDDAIVKAAQERLRLVADLRGMGLTFKIPQGMGKTVLETETQGDINDAVISMDGLRRGVDDRPEYDLGMLPLPITHKDFQFSARQILASRNSGSALDTTMAELAARKVAESVEMLTLGRVATYTYGGGIIYGLLNFTGTMLQILTTPVGAGVGAGVTFLTEVMQMKAQSVAARHYGPWMLYVAPAWDVYLDADFKAESDKTVRERVKSVTGLTDIRTLDFMQNYDVLLVQTTTNVIRVVIGMDITTLQWDTDGGMQKNFKVMCIIVPQVRQDFNSRTGIVLGRVP